MKLIGTIKSIINENKVGDIIQEMGLYDAIRYFGGYDNLMKRMGDYVLSNEDMVDFIKKTVKHLSDKYNDNGVSVWDLDMSPITIGQPDEELQQIEYFSSNGFISINIYGGEYYQYDIASFTEQYEDLNDSTLDEVFLFIVDALENNKSDMKLIGTIKSIVKENKDKSIPNMIKTLGISDAIKYFGNYYTIEPYLKEIDKVNFIKEKVNGLTEWIGGGVGLVEIDEEPIHYDEDENENIIDVKIVN